jgi:hypothetical protein
MKMEQIECSETSVYKFRHGGITHKKAYKKKDIYCSLSMRLLPTVLSSTHLNAFVTYNYFRSNEVVTFLLGLALEKVV